MENRDSPGPPATIRRIRFFAVLCWAVFGLGALIFSGFRAFLGLTCSALVVIISFLWLEDIVNRVLQPAPQANPWRLGVHVFARFTLLGVALSSAIFIARFSPISVTLGFSVIVGAIMIEAVYSVCRPEQSME